jgi:hypothetical protein
VEVVHTFLEFQKYILGAIGGLEFRDSLDNESSLGGLKTEKMGFNQRHSGENTVTQRWDFADILI